MSYTLAELADRSALQKAAADEKIIRMLLGLWVSEFEPSVVYDSRYNIIGLSVAGDPSGTVYVGVLDAGPATFFASVRGKR